MWKKKKLHWTKELIVPLKAPQVNLSHRAVYCLPPDWGGWSAWSPLCFLAAFSFADISNWCGVERATKNVWCTGKFNLAKFFATLFAIRRQNRASHHPNWANWTISFLHYIMKFQNQLPRPLRDSTKMMQSPSTVNWDTLELPPE